jgi:hypothetical protein
MSTCPPNLVHSFLTVCEIITIKDDKKVFFPMPKEDRRVLKVQKKTLSSRHGLCNILFLSLGELGICLQNLENMLWCIFYIHGCYTGHPEAIEWA